MSDTNKATPEDNLYQMLENSVVELGVEKSVNILNSYTPERDRLAREVAEERAQFYCDRCDTHPAADITRPCVHTKARKLLALYKEST